MIQKIGTLLYCIAVVFSGIFYEASFSQAQISADSYTALSTTTYYVSVISNVAVTAGSSFKIVFPSEFTALPSGTASCAYRGISSSSSSPCSFSSNTMAFANCLASSTTPLTINIDISSIKNPNYATTTASLIYSQYDSSSNLIQSTTTGLTVTIVATVMGTVIITPSSQIVALSCKWTIQFTLLTGVSTGGLIEMSTPVWNYGLGSDTNQYYCNGAVTCAGVTSKKYIDLNSALTCSCALGVIQVTLAQTLSAGTFSFSITSLVNPPSASTVAGFRVSTKYNGYYLEQSSSLSVSVTTATSLVISSISIGNTMVSTSTDYYFSTLCSAPVSTAYQMAVTFPSDFSVSTSAVLKGYFGIDRTVITTVTSGVIKFVTGFSGYLDSSNTIQFDITLITNPISIKPSQAITISILTSDNKAVCSSSTGFSVVSTVGTFSGISITPQDSTIYTVTSYAFSMNLDKIVPSTGYIVVTFPSQITIQAATISTCTGIISGLASSSQCTVAGSSLTISSCFATSYAGVVSFTIGQVTNPTSTEVTSAFEIKAYDSYGYYVLYDNTGTVTATSGVLQSTSVVPSSYVTGQSSSYTFSFTVTHTVPSGGTVYIALPSQNSFSSPTCSNPINLSSGYICTFTSTSVTITNGFSSSLATGTIGIQISGIINPGTTQESSSFTINTQLNSYIIDYVNSGLTVTMTTAHEFALVSISTSNDIVGKTASFSFSLTPYNPMYSGGTVLITFPDSVKFPTSPTCTVIGVTTEVTCTRSGSELQATVIFSSSTVTSLYGFTVASCTNPTSTETTDSFEVYSYIGTYKIDKINTGATLSISTPGALLASIALDNYGINESTEYRFTITTTNTLPAGGYFQIIFPSTVTLPTSPICPGSLSCSLSSTSTLDIYYSSTDLSASTIILKVSAVTNPILTGTITFSITSIDSTYLIDSISSVPLSITCHSPCNTCENSADYCLSCITTAPYLYENYCYSVCPTSTTATSSSICEDCISPCIECSLSTTYCTNCNSTQFIQEGKCVSECDSGKFLDNNECVDCSSHCETCEAIDNCTSCLTGYVLDDNSCTDACPTGTTKVNNICEDCTSPCYTCTSSINTCTSCIASYSLYSDQCVLSCPKGTTSINQICETCIDPCVNCAGSTSNCTKCEVYWYLYSSTCVDSCPTDTLIVSDTCVQCNDLCATCINTADNCATCISTAYFYNNKCYSSCPSHTVSINSICTNCTSPCSECSLATNNCTTCINSYYLYNSQCVNDCPTSTTIQYSDYCRDCESPCFTCQDSESNCTSCIENYVLYEPNNTCMEKCPSGYEIIGKVCIKTLCWPGCTDELLKNKICDEECNYEVCSWDYGDCMKNHSNTIRLEDAPLPFTITGVGSGSILAASKLLFPSTSLISATLGLWGVIETGSWIGVLSKISETETLQGRRLLSSDSEVQHAFIFLIVCSVGHFFINITFAVVYFFNVFKKDTTHQFWLSNKFLAKWLIVPLAVFFSFKFIRLLDVNLFGCGCFSAKFDKKSNLYRPLVMFSYISIVLTTLPTMGSLIYILVLYSKGTMVFVLALDSLIITVLVLVLTIYDIVMLSLILEEHKATETQIGAMDTQTIQIDKQKFNIFNTNGEDTDRSMLGFSGKIFPEPEDEFIYKDTNEEPASREKNPNENIITEEDLEEKQEVPNRNMWNISFDQPQMRVFSMPPKILEVIPEEFDLDLSAAAVDDDWENSVVLQHKASGRRILISKTFVPLENDPYQTRIDPNDYLLQEVDKKNVHFGLLKSKTTGKTIKVSRDFNGATVLDVELEKSGQWTIGKIVRKEEEYDFPHAFEDPDDPESVIVWNRPGKAYCIVKKDFKGVPKLDPRTNLPIFTDRIINNYDPNSLQIDIRNCHFANLVTDGKLARVRRNFIGAKVVEVIDHAKYLEKKNKRIEMMEEPELEIKEEKEEEIDAPDIVLPTPTGKKRKPKKPKGPKPKDWGNMEAIYLQRLEPAIKLRKSPVFNPNSVLQGSLDDSNVTSVNMKPQTTENELEILRNS